MGSILSKSEQNPDKWYCGTSVTDNTSSAKHDNNSPSIDFMLIRYDQNKKRH